MLLAKTDVLPLYAQVWLEDPETHEIPQWPRETEGEVIASATCIAVATRDDVKGNIHIEVWRGQVEVDDSEIGPVLFEGTITLSGPFAQVGNDIANHTVTVELGAGEHRVRIMTAPVGNLPERVYFIID